MGKQHSELHEGWDYQLPCVHSMSGETEALDVMLGSEAQWARPQRLGPPPGPSLLGHCPCLIRPAKSRGLVQASLCFTISVDRCVGGGPVLG